MTLWDLLSEEAKRLVGGLVIAAPMIVLACLVLARADKPTGGYDG